MIYTCYEMIRDCRADRAEGWSHLISDYVPMVRKLLAHYQPGDSAQFDPAKLQHVLLALRNPQSSLFQSMEPAPERWFVAELRLQVLLALDLPAAEFPLDLETVAAALEPLTMVEKQAAWIQTMRYDTRQTGAMLRMAPETVKKIRDRAAELIRSKVDAWRPDLLSENGPALGREALTAGSSECLSAKTFLDILDGRMTWRGREELEQHVNKCWHCIDHFCRMVEVVELLRGIQPLSEEESEPYRKLLGVEKPRQSVWKRLAGKG